MGDVINLNRYRKQKQQAERERRANEKRVRFGIPKSRAGQDLGRAVAGDAPARRRPPRRARRRARRLSDVRHSVARQIRRAAPMARALTFSVSMSRPVKRSFTIGGHRTSISLGGAVLGGAEGRGRPGADAAFQPDRPHRCRARRLRAVERRQGLAAGLLPRQRARWRWLTRLGPFEQTAHLRVILVPGRAPLASGAGMTLARQNCAMQTCPTAARNHTDA